MKKYIAVLVAMAMLAVGAFAQTVRHTTLGENGSVCLGTPQNAPTICVELTTDTPRVVTAHYLKTGKHLVLGNQVFFNVSDYPCYSPPSEPVNVGPSVCFGRRFSHTWYLGEDQAVDFNALNRVISVPLTFRPATGKIWQLNEGESVAFVFNKNVTSLLGWVKNPPANRKWQKNTVVVIVHATE